MKLDKVYEPDKHEQDIYSLWEKSGAFTPKKAAHKDSFTIMMPLPNANGKLHIGHVLFITLQDIVTRYQRMKGKQALWLPGADHAGFETWVVYEKELAKQGKSRFDFTREELYKQVWDFVAGHRHTFENQFRELGASVDWSRFTFSLDEKIIRRVYDTFKQMWDDGLIYRGERLVNFCTFHGTSFADIEVEFKEEPGHLWYIKYPLTDGSGSVTVATTRPETMLGDTAVAVNPKDKRYTQFIGKTIKLPLTNREIPIIADDFVDVKFGTGAVKITPAHDPNDFEAAGRHDLPMITVIDHEGKMTHQAGHAYGGKKVEEARQQVISDLEEQGLLVKTESITHSVGHCYKCGTIIQPLLRDQWFIDMKPLAQRAIKVLKANKIKFYPEVKKDQLIRYLEGLRDWNISRQIAWGIPIPAFQNMNDPDDWIYDERVGEAEIKIGNKTYRRDPDVFDTWFSSGQWPYATLSPLDSDDFKQFYPTSLMETGGEILFPWVSRMIMLGLYVTNEVPFKDVYIHGYVLATDGAKMSKSIGNVVDPAGVRLKFGTDALRLGLIDGRAPANNRPYDQTKTIAGRNFANKLWNISRFVEDNIGNQRMAKNKPLPESPADHWILTKLQQLTEVVSADLDNYRFAEAYEKLYHTVWDDLADWYIEVSKVQPNPSVLAFALDVILKLAHPFAPFVSEAIWQSLKWDDDLLIASRWPKITQADKADSQDFEEVINIVSEIRYLSTELGLNKPELYYADSSFISENSDLIQRLSRIGSVSETKAGFNGLQLLQTKHKVWLSVDKTLIHKYLMSLEEQGIEQQNIIKRLQSRLSNKNYVQHAPEAVVEQTRQQLEQAKAQHAKLLLEFKRFSK